MQTSPRGEGERHSIIVIGASAGGVEVLMELLARIPDDIPAALFITIHFPPEAESLLPRILDRRSRRAGASQRGRSNERDFRG